jgi:putative transposase
MATVVVSHASKEKLAIVTFTYPQASINWIDGNKIELPKLGIFKVIWHRPLLEGFTVKTAIITQKVDGWYITLTLEDVSVPEFTSDVEPTADNSIGVDLGLEKFLADSQGKFEPIPQHFRKSKKSLHDFSKRYRLPKKEVVPESC